ncbi:MAG: hypothetical protein ACO1RA_08675 [Planctomycetaceae bacterium]
MNKASFVIALRDSLANHGFQFEPTQVHSHKWILNSPACEIHVLFERYEDDFNFVVVEPGGQQEPMSLLLLRFLANASGSEICHDDETPEFYADLFSIYFSDLLEGNFSIRSRYEEVKDRFFELLFQAQRLPDDDVIKVKILSFDISWMELMRRSKE